MLLRSWSRLWKFWASTAQGSDSARRSACPAQHRARLTVEQLEDRHLLNGDPIGDTIATAFQPVIVPGVEQTISANIETVNDVDMFAVDLGAGDTLTLDIDAQSLGSGLDSFLRVFDSEGTEVASNDDFTGLDSRLTFNVLTGGTFFVGVSSFGNSDYDPNTATSISGFSSGAFDLNLLVGDVSSISGRVFDDLNANGTQDGGETGIVDALVYLDLDGDETLSFGEPGSFTGFDGSYLFPAVTPGIYTVALNVPSGVLVTVPVNGTQAVTVGVQEDVTGVDFGIIDARGSISGRVFFDFNNDGIQNGLDFGIVGQQVRLDLDRNGYFDVFDPLFTTDVGGDYVFSAIAPGTYDVAVDLPMGTVSSFPPGGIHMVSVAARENVISANFGISVGPVSNDAEPNNSRSEAVPLVVNGGAMGTISDGDVDFFELTLAEPGKLIVQTGPAFNSSFDPRLNLYGPLGQLLLTSDDRTETDVNPLLVQHLTAGT